MPEITRSILPNPEFANAKKIIVGTENIPKRKRKNETIPYEVATHDYIENTDVCVIGSGAAGAILANKILKGIDGEEGKNVVLIEKGGYYDPEDFNQREYSMMQVLWKNAGLQLNTDLTLLIAQGEVFGGSTMINDAVCFDTPPIVREQWRDVNGPYKVDIDETKWTNAIADVREKISVSRLSDDDLTKNKNGMILKDACENAGIRGENNERNCINCATCGDCHLGCHYETKQDMSNTYLYEALFNDNLKEFKTFCNCEVKKINHEDGTATGIEAKFTTKDKFGQIQEVFSLKVNAKIVILAGGSIASSAILRSNNIKLDTAGEGLALHPATLLVGEFPQEIRASEGIPMAYSCSEYNVMNYDKNSRPGLAKGGFMLESIFIPIYQFSLQLPSISQMDRFQHYAMAGVMIRDESRGKITLSESGNARIHYELGKSEVKDLTDGMGKLAELFFDSNAVKVITGYPKMTELTSKDQIPALIASIKDDHENGNLALNLGSAHPQGGNRMGLDPKDSTVDKNCKVHGFTNLFVCDASVFPTAIGVNPQVTVMSLATMTADHILQVWDESFENIALKDYRGETGDIIQPMFLDDESLNVRFFQAENSGNLSDISNSNSITANVGWQFDKESLMIFNPAHWRGFIPKIPDELKGPTKLGDNVYDIFKGFWKKFYRDDIDGSMKGKLGVYVLDKDDIDIIAEEKNYPIFGNVIQLTYPQVPDCYDLLKIIDENTILGMVYWTGLPPYPGQPPNGIAITQFSMTKKYSINWMDVDDFNKIFDLSTPTTFDQISGYWSVRHLVSLNILGPVIDILHMGVNDNITTKTNLVMKKILKSEKKSKPEKRKKTAKTIDELFTAGKWTPKIKMVNQNYIIGKFISPPVENTSGIPEALLEDVEENGTTTKRIVVRFTLATFGGDKISIV